MKREPSLVVIASTMRSGSTLLKALLAEAEDVLSLPETNFQNSRTVDRVLKEHSPDDPPIKLLKKPCWYQETRSYPQLPAVPGTKTVALVRDLYDTVVSLRKMTFRRLAPLFSPCITRWLARTYWTRVTRSLADLAESDPVNVRLVRYEDLVADPVETTANLYRFIGSSRAEGTKKYSAPENYSWRWGSDDGSPNIRSLEVQPPKPKDRDEKRIVQIMEQDESIAKIRARLGYVD